MGAYIIEKGDVIYLIHYNTKNYLYRFSKFGLEHQSKTFELPEHPCRLQCDKALRQGASMTVK